MRKEIEQVVTVETPPQDGAFCASFCFPPSFAGFDGHFPGQPVLPGVCLIQAVWVAAELALGRKMDLVEMVLAKFVAVALPDEMLRAECSVSDDNMLRAKIGRGGDRVAEIRLRVRDA